MGYYTEVKVKIKLRKDTPDNVLSLLGRVIIQGDLGHNKPMFGFEDVFVPDIDHIFFKCQRWYMLLLSTNFGGISGGKFYQEKENWIIDLHTEFKNYDDEVDKFIDWVSPFVLGRKKKQYVGWYKGENDSNRTNIYINRVCQVKF